MDAFLSLCVVLWEVREQHVFTDQNLLWPGEIRRLKQQRRSSNLRTRCVQNPAVSAVEKGSCYLSSAEQCHDYSAIKAQTEPFVCVNMGALTTQCWNSLFWSCKQVCCQLSHGVLWKNPIMASILSWTNRQRHGNIVLHIAGWGTEEWSYLPKVMRSQLESKDLVQLSEVNLQILWGAPKEGNWPVLPHL